MCDKKKQYVQVFRSAYSTQFSCILKSDKGEKHAFCTVCRCDINISHGGKNDITNHLKCAKHVSNLKDQQGNKKIKTYFGSTNSVENEVIQAECLFTGFLVEHNIAFSVADHVGPLLRKMFPKCDVAKQYSCGRTKTTAIVNEMALDAISHIVDCLQNGPFCLSTDGSTDSGSKLYPLVVTYFDPKSQLIESSLLSIPALQGDSTGKNIGELLLTELKCLEVPYEHCVAFCSDNASVMVGAKNGVVALLKQKQPNLISIGCLCHLVNLAAEKASAIMPVKLDEIVVDIYYYLEKSSKRKDKLQKFQELHNKETRKILKHVCTRWLTLSTSLARVVEQWEPLLSFFKEEVKVPKSQNSLSSYRIPKKAAISDANPGSISKRKPESDDGTSVKRQKCSTEEELKSSLKSTATILSREEKLFMFLSSSLNKSFCMFVLSVTPLFDKLNLTLQSASPQIHILLKLLLDFLKELFSRFVKPSAVKSINLLEVNYHEEANLKESGDIVVGCSTERIVATLPEKEKKLFFSTVIKYYISACDYIIHKFPLKSEILKKAQVTQIENIEQANFSDVRYFIDLFPIILSVNSGESRDVAVDEVQKQFTSLQLEDLSAVLSKQDRIDAVWSHIGSMKNSDTSFKYDKISKVMLAVLLVPHSNAECERIFSVVKKNKTAFRSSLSNKTVQNISVLKSTSSECYNRSYSEDFLKRAKRATTQHLQSQKEKPAV